MSLYVFGRTIRKKNPECSKSRRFQYPIVKKRFYQVSQETEFDKMHIGLYPITENL